MDGTEATGSSEAAGSTETRIGEWRSAILRNRAVTESDADELEEHLREQVADLGRAGLSGDEAFLIAMRRLGEVDRITAEYAREHSDRLWKQLAVPEKPETQRSGLLVMLGFATLAGALALVANLASRATHGEFSWYMRDFSLFSLPVLAAWFALQRRMSRPRVAALASVVAIITIVISLYPFALYGTTSTLVSMHLPIVLWFVVGAAYMGGELRSSARRMDFLRFSGEWAIYYTLIALGGAVLLLLTTLILGPIIPEVNDVVTSTILPVGAAGAVIVAAWLVEVKKSIVENLAPVLAAIFTPLFAFMLAVAVIPYAGSGIWGDFNRELVTVFDALLLVVLALVVYGISARDAAKSPGVMDAVRLWAVAAAVILDGVVLYSMFLRIGEYGFTANRLAALGLNVILFVNLVVTAWLLARFLAKRIPAAKVEQWQTAFLPVFAVWVLFVVLAVPPIFGFD